jgi:hypothetical protein
MSAPSTEPSVAMSSARTNDMLPSATSAPANGRMTSDGIGGKRFSSRSRPSSTR